MFTPPPRPPKDYVLKDVANSLLSSAQFGPEAQPRVTQPNLAKFCAPVEASDDEPPTATAAPAAALNARIVERMVSGDRAGWVAAPGRDAFLVHEVCERYSGRRGRSDFDPRYMHKEKVFNRSYQFELDCIEAARLDKLRAKCELEDAEFEESFQKLINNQKAKEKPTIKLKSCKEEPPFWWEEFEPKEESEEPPKPTNLATSTVYRSSYVRWQDEPNLTAFVQDDPCRRKMEMLMVGQPFRTEACNWYYKTYPPPAMEFHNKKFP